MEKKEVYICQQQCNIEEDEIDLIKLFKTIWNYKNFVIGFTFFITLLSAFYIFSVKPIYKIEAFLELGKNNNVYFINPNKALILINNNFKKEKGIPNIKSLKLKKGTKILDLSIEAYSNNEAQKYLENIILFLHTKENKKIELLKNNIQLQIKQLIQYKNSLSKQLKIMTKKLDSRVDPVVYQALLNNINKLNQNIFDMNNKIEQLKLQLSPLNITQTKIIGNVIKYDYPEKPKKKLIIIIAFITSFILSIFLVFFIEFIKGLKEEDK